jgi:molybdate transport system substrate-binding protein
MAVTPIFAFLLVALSACTAENTVDTDSASQTPEQTQTLRIAAAANLSDVLPQIVDGYKTDENLAAQNIDVTYASSGKLYAQIKAGAPYDIFLSANQEFPAKLAAERVVNNAKNNESYTPFTYTQGQLALYSVTKSLHGLEPATLSDLLIKDANGKIAIANPELAPYGASAQTYLQSQNLYNTLNKQKRLIQGENIGQAFQYAHTGSVDYGFVAQSQIIAIKAKPEQFITLAPTSYPAILQDGIVISDAPIAADFTDYLRSKAGQHYFSQAGYLMVK